MAFLTTLKDYLRRSRRRTGRPSSDAGFVQFADTFDLATGDPISSEVVFIKGLHPDLESDFALFCEVITGALG